MDRAGKFVLLWTATLVAVYLLNPLGVPSWDPRGRLLGHIPYRIPATSMNPTLRVGNHVVVTTYSYLFSNPARQDIIVFKYPPKPEVPYVKRIAGLPGDRVRIREGVLFVNDIAVDEPYLAAENNQRTTLRTTVEFKVPTGQLFVLGDNRDNSNDSRYWGYVPRENIIGRVDYIF